VLFLCGASVGPSLRSTQVCQLLLVPAKSKSHDQQPSLVFHSRLSPRAVGKSNALQCSCLSIDHLAPFSLTEPSLGSFCGASFVATQAPWGRSTRSLSPLVRRAQSRVPCVEHVPVLGVHDARMSGPVEASRVPRGHGPSRSRWGSHESLTLMNGSQKRGTRDGGSPCVVPASSPCQ
jgi:hypothetical protein